MENNTPKFMYRLIRRRNAFGEYVIRAYTSNGKYVEEASYYTDDWVDALGTLGLIASRESKTIRRTNAPHATETWEVR